MKMITSIEFEMEMPAEDIEAYNTMSIEERNASIEEMEKIMADLIDSNCVGEVKFTKFNIDFTEGE